MVNIQQPHVASGYFIGQYKKNISNLFKVLFNRIAVLIRHLLSILYLLGIMLGTGE